jgi:uncharacterized LabA/DUF88 family protein
MLNKDETITAVFIDGAWLWGASKRIGKMIDYRIFFNNLIRIFGTKIKIHFYSSIDPTNKQQEKFYTSLSRIGYIIHCVKIKKIGNRIIAGGLDIALAVDAIQTLPVIKKFVLISGDGDFAHLLERVRKVGVHVSVIAFPFSCGYSLRKIANNFINLETLIGKHKNNIKLPTFKKGAEKKNINQDSLFIEKGECLSSYRRIRDLIISVKKKIIIVDSYIDEQILLVFTLLGLNINITIFTEKPSQVDFCTQIEKLRKEGRIIKVLKTNAFHDRFVGIDSMWWHSGHSLKNLGEKYSMLTKMAKKDADKLEKSLDKESQNSQEICNNLI